ncbi:NAD-dependent epimerase/dehydratase family protein [uncultured Sulfitobacter sp.]|jgi:dihydroflavonol-4-reductase|uniref:NAD-dependent epimerase/dehydratase family protein n=1 Tax=uncultured Sulfitobacter sp. TaxID=191468 RepID=UPI0025925FA3|nr:NAD-dependent epimerase/dehydratase family protein [uncultured Sulfitobacter sp.]
MTKLNIDGSTPVLVTGATGYVAGWLIKQLLEAGVPVHAAVRDPDNIEKRAHLDKMAEETTGTITYFKADLLEEDSFDTAMQGVGIVFHTASPFIVKYDDPQRDLVDPAVKGTQNVLNAATRAKSVKRVVLTSSCAAIFSDINDVLNAPGGILTEEVWNETSTLEDNPYSLSKTLAEKAAWKIAEGQSQWDLIVINPALVVGPGTAARQTSASFDYVRMLADGTFKAGAPEFQIGMVDVRDVADAHVRGGYMANASGRHITFAKALTLFDLADSIRAELPDLALPASKSYDGPEWKADNTRSIKDLGVSYRDPRDGVAEMVRQLIADGQI